MTISDIITLISLVIAIVAIINEKNRAHLLLKFSTFDFVLYLLGFLLINYFVFYEYFFENDLKLNFLFFENFGFEDPKIYSYLISILILGSILYKVLFSFYPSKRKWQVEKHYNSLIEANEISMLSDLIDKYHTNDILDRIRKNNRKTLEVKRNHLKENLFDKPLKTLIKLKLKKQWRNFYRYSETNKSSLGVIVLYNVVNHPAFIKLASNSRPFFFTNLISSFTLEKSGLFPGDLVKRFLVELIREKNFFLINEIKQAQNLGSGLNANFFKFNKILNALLHDLSVAEVNEIWLPFGEEALQEIGAERNKGELSEFKFVYQNEDELWDFKSYLAINFFHTLIIESIVKGYKNNFFLIYYWYITERILGNLELLTLGDIENNTTRYHQLIIAMNSNLFSWLLLANKHKSDRFYDIIFCLGYQIDSITQSECFGHGRTLNLLDRMLRTYCDIKKNEDSDHILVELEKILLKPIGSRNKRKYLQYISIAWEQFDKIPHRIGNQDLDYFKRLKENVIIPLGLDPSLH